MSTSLLVRSTAALGILALSASAAAAQLVLRDDFSSKSSGWPDNSANAIGALGIALYTDSGGYQMTPVEDATIGVMPAPRQAKSGDVRLATDLFLYAGIGNGMAGVVCRYRDHENFYALGVAGTGNAMIVRMQDGKATKLAEAKVELLIPNTVDTRVQADCDGDRLSFSVGKPDEPPVEIEARDTALAEGQSGLLVMGENLAGTHGLFDNFELHDLAE